VCSCSGLNLHTCREGVLAVAEQRPAFAFAFAFAFEIAVGFEFERTQHQGEKTG